MAKIAVLPLPMEPKKTKPLDLAHQSKNSGVLSIISCPLLRKITNNSPPTNTPKLAQIIVPNRNLSLSSKLCKKLPSVGR